MKNERKKGGGFKRGGKKSSIERDPFFEEENKKRRKVSYDDDDIESVESDLEENGFTGGDEASKKFEEVEDDEDEFAGETAGETRKRLAEVFLNRAREAKRRERDENDDDDEDDEEEEDDEGLRKSLMQNQLEESGRVRRVIASR